MTSISTFTDRKKMVDANEENPNAPWSYVKFDTSIVSKGRENRHQNVLELNYRFLNPAGELCCGVISSPCPKDLL